MDSVSCDIYGGDNELIGQENREETLANMKGGLVNCFCDTSIICATNYSTFEKFFSEASPQEKQFYDPFKNIGVPKAEELLAEYMYISFLNIYLIENLKTFDVFDLF
nr:unnamed protein product [Haemonchus contortus]